MANDTSTTAGDLDVEFVPEKPAEGGFVGSRANDDKAARFEGARQAVRDEAGKAGDKLRALADDGKARATGALDGLADMIKDAAGTIDEKVGAQYGGYARQASGAVADFSEKLRGKDVDDLMSDAREFVRKSPGVAIGVAAAVGFVLARVLRSGADNRDS